MTVRDSELKAHRFKVEEKRQKLQDLDELRQHIHATLDRMSRNEEPSRRDEQASRRETLCKSLEEIDRQATRTQTELHAIQQTLDDHTNARDVYDRVPVAIGSRRGRGQVEHVRIVRTQRD